MLAIHVDFVGGVAHLDSGAYRNGGQIEWPPHPDRFFMALVAAAHRGRAPSDGEIKALEWIETQPVPFVRGSDAMPRPTLKSYMPTNDQLVANRKKEKLLSSCTPDESNIAYVWQNEPSPDIWDSLNSIVDRVTYLGRSESIVSCEVSTVDDAGMGWLPDPNGRDQMRVPHPGRLADLKSHFDDNLRPPPGAWMSYRFTGESRRVSGEWSDLMVFQLSRAVGLEHFIELTDATRKAVMALCADPLPDWLSGHQPDGSPVNESHVAFIPLADVGSRYASGNILGVGIAIPREVSPAVMTSTLSPLLQDTAFLGNDLKLGSVKDQRKTTSPETWMKESCVWSTVTPMTLSRWPKKQSVEELVAVQVLQADLPLPTRINIHSVSKVKGGLGKRFVNPPNRYRIHATFEWNVPITGPIVVGANRYQGMGLCKAI